MRITFLFLAALFLQISSVSSEETSVPELYTEDGVLKKGEYLGPTDIAISQDGATLFVLESDAWRVRKMRIDGSSKPESLDFDFRPERFEPYAGGTRLAVVGGGVRGRLVVVDTETMKKTLDLRIGHTPSDVAVFSDGAQVIAYASNRFEGSVSVVDLSSGKETARWKAGREPITLAVTPDGRKLIVAGHLPENRSLDPKVCCLARIFDTKTGESREIQLRNGTVNVRDIVIVPDGRYAFVTAQIGHFEQTPIQVDGGWMNENVIEAIDIERADMAETFFLDDFGRGAANAWGITISDDARFLAVSHSGSCEISLVLLSRLVEILDSHKNVTGRGQGTVTSANLRPVDAGLPTRLRVPMGLKGLRHLVMRENRVFATVYFEDSIASCTLKITEPVHYIPGYISDLKVTSYPKRTEESHAMESGAPLRFEPLEPVELMEGVHLDRSVARLGPEPVLSPVRKGEMIFHDATRCYEKWQSCVSCHQDGRGDTLNWDLLNDGMGNPKNTKSMLYAHETPPAMATGVRANAETAVRSGVKAILFAKVVEDDALAMDEYLKSLRPVPSPHLVDGKLSESARRGKRLFESSRTGCSSCHPEQFYTDFRMHDVGTRSDIGMHSDFDTPTLIEVWRTSPYLHDGRYRTIKEVIREGKHVNGNGEIDKLAEGELDDLVEYVLSL